MIGWWRAVRVALIAAFAVACDGASLVLPPDAEQGIEGRVWLGPQCPVLPADGSCPDAPYAAVLRIQTAGGAQVTSVRSGSDGRFRVGLQPGRYRIDPRPGDPFPHAPAVEVTVAADRWSAVEIVYDTGIR